VDESPSCEIDLTGRVAVVTGGGRGIGRAIALALAGCGAPVAVVARTEGQLAETVERIEHAGGRATAAPADASDPSAVQRMVAEVEKTLGPVEILVNCAGVSGPIGPTWETDPEDWWTCLEVNLRGPMLCSRAVLPSMIARRSGRIVNVASGAGTQAIAYLSAYVVSKTALIRLTENLDREAREYGIRLFAIEPGTVRTTMTDSALESEQGRKWLPWMRDVFEQRSDVPPDRAGRLVALLASGRADALSGRFLTIYDDIPGMVEQIDP